MSVSRPIAALDIIKTLPFVSTMCRARVRQASDTTRRGTEHDQRKEPRFESKWKLGLNGSSEQQRARQQPQPTPQRSTAAEQPRLKSDQRYNAKPNARVHSCDSLAGLTSLLPSSRIGDILPNSSFSINNMHIFPKAKWKSLQIFLVLLPARNNTNLFHERIPFLLLDSFVQMSLL